MENLCIGSWKVLERFCIFVSKRVGTLLNTLDVPLPCWVVRQARLFASALVALACMVSENRVVVRVVATGDGVRQWFWCYIDLHSASIQLVSWPLQSRLAQQPVSETPATVSRSRASERGVLQVSNSTSCLLVIAATVTCLSLYSINLSFLLFLLLYLLQTVVICLCVVDAGFA